MNNMDVNKLQTLADNAEFITKLSMVESTEELIAHFAAEGIVVTTEDIEKVRVGSGELAENELEDVSGGFVIKGPIYWLGYLLGKLITKSGC